MGQPQPLLLIFNRRAFYKLGFQWKHFRYYGKLCSVLRHVSADGRECWVGVTLASRVYKRLPSSRRQLPTQCPLIDALHDCQNRFDLLC